jgi:hypothetical protein
MRANATVPPNVVRKTPLGRVKSGRTQKTVPVQEAALVSFLREEANRATETARHSLNEKGIGYVVEENGIVVEKRELG